MKKKIELILNIVIIVLALALTVVFEIDGNWVAAIGFAIIAVLNVAALVIRAKGEK